MRTTIERSVLYTCLGHIHRVVDKRNTIPILSNALFTAEGGTVTLKATDLDLEIVEEMPAMVEQAGATTVPAHMLHDIVRKLPDGLEIALETSEDGASMTVQAGSSRFSLQILPEDDFPQLSSGEFSHNFVLPASALRVLIERAQFAISTEETRYYLNGIYLHTVEEDGLTMLRAVATDGHRLAQVQIEAPDGAAGMPSVIVPRKAVAEIQKLLDDPELPVHIELSETKIRLKFRNAVLTSKLIDGTFPDYTRVIPAENDKEMKVNRQAFSAAVDRVSTISSERGRAVKMSLTEGQLVLSVTNPDSGTAREELAVEYSNDDLEIGFNSKYLMDIASQIDNEIATFRLSDPSSPTLVDDRGTNDALYVLMPMRV